MRLPYDWVMMALSYIKGPLVNDWVKAQEKAADNKLTRTTNPLLETDDALWMEFDNEFTSAWKDTTRQQNAFEQLMQFQMKGRDVDTYIATFE